MDFGSSIGPGAQSSDLTGRAERIIYFVVNGQEVGPILEDTVRRFACAPADELHDNPLVGFLRCCVEALQSLAPVHYCPGPADFPALAAYYKLDLEARIAFALVAVEGVSYRIAGQIMRMEPRKTARLVAMARRSFLSSD